MTLPVSADDGATLLAGRAAAPASAPKARDAYRTGWEFAFGDRNFRSLAGNDHNFAAGNQRIGKEVI
jgi:hypothetical protein